MKFDRWKLTGSAFPRFLIVGGCGFLADALLLEILHRGFRFDLFSGRCLSYLGAATLTWWLNRHFTFQSSARPSFGEWLRYLWANGLGALINYGLYAGAILLHPIFRDHPWLAVAVGSLTALIFNYLINRHYVFRRPDLPAEPDGKA